MTKPTVADERIEIIEWVDSRSFSGWSSKRAYDEHARSSLLCHSVGMVFHEDADRVALFQSATLRDKDGDQLYDHSIIIPKVAIVSRKVLIGKPTR